MKLANCKHEIRDPDNTKAIASPKDTQAMRDQSGASIGRDQIF